MNKDNAIQSLKNLKEDLGWKDIVRVLKENVKDARKDKRQSVNDKSARYSNIFIFGKRI